MILKTKNTLVNNVGQSVAYMEYFHSLPLEVCSLIPFV